ncbi:conserved protein of unknown function [Petrocella atlantisensis]|uniref:Uncharacterized protein n=2 Tax=Petrocella atlantisensis TaxID=2173034 RepID=A0A3P7PVL1_9FIRM|nr:conserved protein of unknown function [Petrocella atlantisensis]
MSKDFEVVESRRGKVANTSSSGTVNNKLQDALADNMGNIIELAKDITDINRMKVQSDAILAKMAEDRKMLITEAEAYVLRKNVDTKNTVDKMRVVQDLLRDFYTYNKNGSSNLTGEEFTKVISDILNTME